MEAVYRRCAGLDVRKKTVVECVLTSTDTGTATQEGRTRAKEVNHLLRTLESANIKLAAVATDGVG